MDEKSLMNDKDILKIVGNEDKILLIKKIVKVNRFGFSQERFIIVTEKYIFNLKKKSK